LKSKSIITRVVSYVANFMGMMKEISIAKS